MINHERIKNLLLELVQIDSHSRKERDVAQCLKKYCEEMGAQVEIDDAGEKVGGNTGNVIARFPGTIPGADSTTTSVSTAPGFTALTVAGRTLRARNFIAFLLVGSWRYGSD